MSRCARLAGTWLAALILWVALATAAPAGEQPLDRQYDALDRVEGPFGPLWHTSLDIRATEVAGQGFNYVLIRLPDRTLAKFRESGYHAFSASPAVDGALEQNDAGLYTLRFRNGEVWAFNARRRIDTRQTRTGLVTHFAYDSQARLVGLTEPSGRAWTIAYNAYNKVASVTDGTSSWTYTYDERGRLTDAVYPDAGHIQYGYQSPNGAWYLTSATNRRGQVLGQYEYDMFGRLASYTHRGRKYLRQYGDGTYTEWPEDTPTQTVTRRFDSQGHSNEEERPGSKIGNYYDPNGFLVTAIDARGNVTRHSYDAMGNRTSTVDPLGNTTRFAYDSEGRLTCTTDALGHETRTAYDDRGNPVSVADARGAVVRRTYTAANLLETQTDPAGNLTRFEHDALGRTTSQNRSFMGNAIVHSWTYDPDGNRASETDPRGNRTDFQYDTMGRLTRITAPPVTNGATGESAEPVTELAYDADGNLVSRTDPAGNVIRWQYDAWGAKTQETDAANAVTRWAYSEGRLVATTDPAWRQSFSTYDNQGRLLARLDAAGGTTSAGYDGNGNVVSRTDARGGVTTMTVDALNRVVAVGTPDGAISRRAYDAVGNESSETDALGQARALAHDEVNRLVERLEPDGSRTRFEYDANGNRTAVARAFGTVQAVRDEYTYDELNRLAAVTRAKGTVDEVTVRYGYDPNGNVFHVINGRGKEWDFFYDAANRLIAESDPLGRNKHYSYDLAGRLLERVDAKGQRIRYRYSPAGKVLEATYIRTDGSVENIARMSYDSVGNMVRVTDSNVDIEQNFDALNRITAINHRHLQKIQRQGWDAAGNRTWMSVDGIPNSTATYEYDAMNRLAAIHHAAFGDVGYTYNLAGQKTGLNYPNGIAASYKYDPNGRLTTLAYRHAGNTPFWQEDLTYDARGNIITRVDDEGTHSYQYDWLDQLTRAQYPDSTYEEFAYDKSGNRSSVTTAGGVATYTVDDADQLVSVRGPGQSEITTFGWTPNGEMASRLASGQTTPTSYEWSAREMMTRVSLPSGMVVTHSYLPEQWLGWRLTASNLATGPVAMLWDPVTGNLLADLDDHGSASLKYFEGASYDQHIAIAASTPTGGSTCPLTDHIGSVMQFYQQSSSSSQKVRYGAYGAPRETSDFSGVASRFSFTGREWDHSLRISSYRSRWYSPWIGLFLSRDPVSKPGRSPLLYAANSPVVYFDPLGMDEWKWPKSPGASWSQCVSKARDLGGRTYEGPPWWAPWQGAQICLHYTETTDYCYQCNCAHQGILHTTSRSDKYCFMADNCTKKDKCTYTCSLPPGTNVSVGEGCMTCDGKPTGCRGIVPPNQDVSGSYEFKIPDCR